MKKSFSMNEEFDIILGKNDRTANYNSKWPIYFLDVYDKKGLWKKIQDKLKILENLDLLKEISEKDLIEYFKNNSDVDFEILFFEKLMTKHFIFKINDKIYSYTVGNKSKRKIYARFYFDLNELLLLNLSV
jgi:hypothetical protein